MLSSRRRRVGKGFTLIELMIVVAIIALLISILLPSLARAREQAMQVACAANLNAIFKGFFYYTEDESNGNGHLPQLGWRNDYGYWTDQICDYIKIKRSKARSRNGLLVCPAHENPAIRVICGPNAGSESTVEEKIRSDSGQSGGTQRRGRGGSGGGSSSGLGELIEPVSYTGTCDALENKIWPQVSSGVSEYPMKWANLKRPSCFIMLTETAGGELEARTARCFRINDLLDEAKTDPAYKRHYGGQSAFSNGSNFLFADGHVQWHAANFAATRMICCMDFGFNENETPSGNQASAENRKRSQCRSGSTRRGRS